MESISSERVFFEIYIPCRITKMVPPAKQRFNTSIMLIICDMINDFMGVIQMSKIGEAICYTIIPIGYIIILK
tara:strand:- start:215 stop:433 length:219 start_codon:yes stop_codon:yes gene_type:complete